MDADKKIEALKKEIDKLMKQIQALAIKDNQKSKEIRSLKNRLTQLEPIVEGLRRRVK